MSTINAGDYLVPGIKVLIRNALDKALEEAIKTYKEELLKEIGKVEVTFDNTGYKKDYGISLVVNIKHK